VSVRRSPTAHSLTHSSLAVDILLDGHRLVEGVDLLRLLAQGTHTAEPIDTAVGQRRAGNVALTADLATDDCPADEVDQRADTDNGVQHARLANFFGNLSGRVARHEVGDDADTAVVEAAAKSVLKVGHYCCYQITSMNAPLKSWRAGVFCPPTGQYLFELS